ncbi:MAG: DUF262 domain-containing protein [Phycisphaerae bacterium]
MTIGELVQDAVQGTLVLPAIQRNFIWPERKVTLLLDSVMRGYPVGLILLWETYSDIQYREFGDIPERGQVFHFRRNSQHRPLAVVLDGHQRLMSFLHALRGRPQDKRQLHFDLLSGAVQDGSGDARYRFRFMTPERARLENGPSVYYVATKRLYAMGEQETSALLELATAECGLNKKGADTLLQNSKAFRDAMSRDDNVVQVSTIDKDVPPRSSARKTESDVLEAFIRINRQGTPLSHSDLIFSTLKLRWKKSAEALPSFVQRINRGNSFNLDTDFVIRCLLAVSGLKTEFDTETLRHQANVKKVKQNFPDCCEAIRSAISFAKNKCWCSSAKLIRTTDNLVPFVYYFFRTQRRRMPDAAVKDARKALYLLSFTGVLCRYAHSRLGKLIREALDPRIEEGATGFPLKDIVDLVRYWNYGVKYDEALLQGNPSLALHLVRQPDAESAKHPMRAPQLERIFPRSALRGKHDRWLIDHFANFWVPVSRKQNTTEKHPKKYLDDVSEQELREALIDRKLLDYRRYTTFIEQRAGKILKEVDRKVGFTEAGFA